MAMELRMGGLKNNHNNLPRLHTNRMDTRWRNNHKIRGRHIHTQKTPLQDPENPEKSKNHRDNGIKSHFVRLLRWIPNSPADVVLPRMTFILFATSGWQTSLNIRCRHTFCLPNVCHLAVIAFAAIKPEPESPSPGLDFETLVPKKGHGNWKWKWKWNWNWDEGCGMQKGLLWVNCRGRNVFASISAGYASSSSILLLCFLLLGSAVHLGVIPESSWSWRFRCVWPGNVALR